MTNNDWARMFQWLLFSIICYFIAAVLASWNAQPQVQVIFWKVGHLALGANLGYWIDRNAFKRSRVNELSPALFGIRRAIIIAAAILALALGL
jgi:hypothetical protein